MAENAKNPNQMVVYALVAIIVLLIAIVGIMFVNNSKNDVPPVGAAPTAPTGQTPTPQTPTGGAPTGGTQAPPLPAGFDPATATKIPAGMEPKDFVEEYYKAVDSGDWETAWNHQPAEAQASSTPESLKEQLAGYGIVGYAMGEQTIEGDQAVVNVDQQTDGYGTFVNGWLFVKSGDTWAVAAKKVVTMK